MLPAAHVCIHNSAFWILRLTNTLNSPHGRLRLKENKEEVKHQVNMQRKSRSPPCLSTIFNLSHYCTGLLSSSLPTSHPHTLIEVRRRPIVPAANERVCSSRWILCGRHMYSFVWLSSPCYQCVADSPGISKAEYCSSTTSDTHTQLHPKHLRPQTRSRLGPLGEEQEGVSQADTSIAVANRSTMEADGFSCRQIMRAKCQLVHLDSDDFIVH